MGAPCARLRRPFLFDRSLFGGFCRVAYSSTRDFLRRQASGTFRRVDQAVPVMIASPQSFGDLIVPNPHLHAVVSLGLFRPDGVFLPMEDVDFSGLEEIFRERFFRLMLRRQKVRPETVERMRAWEHSGFNVDFGRKFDADDRGGLEGLLSYMERAPVSLRRLTYRSDGMVHYQGTKLHPRLGTDHQLLSPVEFLAHLVHHVLLRFEVSSRSYGALSTTFRRKLGWLQHPPVHVPPPEPTDPGTVLPDIAQPPHPQSHGFVSPGPVPPAPESEVSDFLKKRRRAWARLIAKTWHVDPSLCASCGRPMKIIAALTSPHQEDEIERILRHIQLWDPPWKRTHKARGPPIRRGPTSPLQPPPPEPCPEQTIDPIVDDTLYSTDPIPPDNVG